ncbi:MAG: AAA family ATPase [Desulfarculaceae bacterium]|nr:AAA family ATPase [Desulfarculaceae bacterium]MCF8071369.1 AAA family ATPase [Desulfarculaceae bacterium]MCF8101694.1 AAA family ATPase [Desulfarculaceae bacterium]MCF8116697.1 AAA family ATPase [Desulfarculaceae bacterium]
MASAKPPDNSDGVSRPWDDNDLTPSQREAMATLIVSAERSEGWAMVVGQAGSGKGELIDCLCGRLPDNYLTVVISAQKVHSPMDLCREVGPSLNIPECNYKARFLLDLRAAIETCHREGKKILLLVKDAHMLSEEMLQELELLGNTDQFSPRVLNVFVFARPQILPVLERMGATNLKHHLRRFRRLEPKYPTPEAEGERRSSPRQLQGIDYSLGGDRQPAAKAAISYDSPRAPEKQGPGSGKDILEKAFGPSLQPKTLPVLD